VGGYGATVTPTEHPIQVRLRDGELARNRWTVLFRLILAVPQLIWWYVWTFGMALLLPIAWVAALVLARLPDWAHEVLERYLRFNVHLWAYLSLAADPWPGFVGERDSYPVDVDVAPPQRQRRVTILFRLVLALPPYLLLATLGAHGGGGTATTTTSSGSSTADAGGWEVAASSGGGLLLTIAVLGWFYVLARGRMSPGFRDAAVYVIGYAAQVHGYLALLTERYPSSSPKLSRPAPMRPHPVAVELDDDLRRSRLTVAFRALLAVPHLVWLTLWGLVALLAAIVSWVATLIAGRTPDGLHRFLAAYVRYQAHVSAFLWLAANPFPGFVGAEGSYPYDVRVAPPERQHRGKTAFRLVLAIPAWLVGGALSTVQLVAAIGGWVASVLTGRMPEGLRDLSAWATRYHAQTVAYVLLLTDRYPDATPTLEVGGDEPAPAPAPDAPGAAHHGWEPPSPDWGRAPEAV
jgi:hypothetical protein